MRSEVDEPLEGAKWVEAEQLRELADNAVNIGKIIEVEPMAQKKWLRGQLQYAGKIEPGPPPE